ncbi:MAG TPA: hypothetical protein VLG36_03540 [Candidatus Chromulinivoraceae bacterium]|nr:hypothetical protein [Candidatus Chromulinivoraceae bacterium]
MRRGRVIVVAVLAVAILVTAGWFFYSRSQSPVNPALPSRLTESQVSFLESGLNSQDKSEQAKILTPPLRSGEWNPGGVRANGTTVKIDPSSFVADGLGGAHVNAKVSGLVSAEFVLTLAYIDGQWFLVTSTKK